MEPHGSASRADANFLELEPDEELLCSVSHITEHLGRNITVVLDTALSEIRKMVSIRIRVLKMELHQKSEEIEILKARLGSIQRDSKEPFPGAATSSSGTGPSGEASPRKADCNPASKHGSVDPRRAKTVVPGVKKENIDAICDYLMKDKNSRGPAVELEGNQSQAHNQEAEPDSLHLWPDGGMASSGPGHGDAESASEDLFAMLPSGSKRMYDYEWISPMAYSSDLKVMKDPGCESAPTGEANNDDDDEDEDDCDDDNRSRRDSGRLEHGHAPLSHVQPPDFSMEPQNSPGEGEGPLRATADRSITGPPFISSHTYICSLCGTFCPDAVFLEEHLKLIHPDSAAAAAAAEDEQQQQQQQQLAGRPLQSTCCSAPRSGGGEQLEGGAGVAGGASRGPRPFKKENKLEGGYECGDCGRHFNYLGNLRQHQRIHTGEKPFVCPECGERFRHAARLKSHRLVHSGAQSPFPCPQCGKGFSVLSGLKRHQRVHTGESPYACPQCGRRFKELGNLYTHQRIHSGATPYRCQHCGRSFRHLGTFKSHRCSPPPQ